MADEDDGGFTDDWMGRGSRAEPKRRTTLSSIKSRIISPLMPPVVAHQAMTSRSQVSKAKATRTPHRSSRQSPSRPRSSADWVGS
jgi:hypothetical protein